MILKRSDGVETSVCELAKAVMVVNSPSSSMSAVLVGVISRLINELADKGVLGELGTCRVLGLPPEAVFVREPDADET